MNKSIVFVSHIFDERRIAEGFKALIEKHFLGLITVFLSSDGESVQMGQKWLDNISNALRICSVEVVICSPVSIARPWINFEAGAGWVRGIPVIPLCHSGISPSDLPIPLNMLQAARATDVSGLKLVFPVLASAIGARTPEADFTDFIELVSQFEIDYTFWPKFNEKFDSIHGLSSEITNALKSGKIAQVHLSSDIVDNLVPKLEWLEHQRILRFRKVASAYGPYGPSPSYS